MRSRPAEDKVAIIRSQHDSSHVSLPPSKLCSFAKANGKTPPPGKTRSRTRGSNAIGRYWETFSDATIPEYLPWNGR